MISVLIQFTLPQAMPADKMAEISLDNAPMYQDTPGLVRKYYVSTDGGRKVGGMYLWESREAAEATYDDAWHDRVTETYGSPPEMIWFNTPVVVDNRHGEIVS